MCLGDGGSSAFARVGFRVELTKDGEGGLRV